MQKKDLFISLGIILIFTAIPAFYSPQDLNVYFQISSYVMLVFMVAFMTQYFYETRKRQEQERSRNGVLKYNLDDKEVWLIDYENCPYLPKELSEIDNLQCFIFGNISHHDRIKDQLRMFDKNLSAEIILSSKTGKNLVDIEIGTYVGLISSSFNPTKIIIYSKDKGYQAVFDALDNINIRNISLVRPNNEKLFSDDECRKLYKKINWVDELSIGNFKKRLKNTKLNMNPDEVEFLIKHFEEQGWIEVKEIGKEKRVYKKTA